MTQLVNSDFSRIVIGLEECDTIKFQVVAFQYVLNVLKRKHTCINI